MTPFCANLLVNLPYLMNEIMTRLLILLIAFNAIFPASGFASVCASAMTHVSENIVIESHNINHDEKYDLVKTTAITTAIQQQPNSAESGLTMNAQEHCSDPTMSCHHKTTSLDTMDCSSGCCANCLGASFAVLTSLAYTPFSHYLPTKPASGDTNFYTHIISPELRPPLV